MKTLLAKQSQLYKKKQEERLERSRQLKIYLKGFNLNEKFLLTFENQAYYLKIIIAKNEQDSYKQSSKFSLDYFKKFKSFSQCNNINDVYDKLVSLINQKDTIQIFLYKELDEINLVIKDLITAEKIIFEIKHKDKKLKYDEYSDDFLDKDISESNLDSTNLSLSDSIKFSPVFNMISKGIANKLLGRKRDYFDYDIYNKKRVKHKINNNNDENNINKKLIKVIKKYPNDNDIENDIRTIPLTEEEEQNEIIDLNNQSEIIELQNENEENFISLEEASKYIDIEVESGPDKEKEKKQRLRGNNIFNVTRDEQKEIMYKSKKENYSLTPEEIKNLFQKRHHVNNRYHKLNKYHLEKNDLFKSKIIKNESEMNLILSAIKLVNKDSSSENMKSISLIYTSKKDGTSSSSFHLKCDYKPDILIIIKTKTNSIFGGYTKNYFDSEKNMKKIDKNSFLFNINKMKIFLPHWNKFCMPGIFNNAMGGPCFLNGALSLGKNLVNDVGYVGYKECGYKLRGDFEVNNGMENFYVAEIEIYQVLFDDKLHISKK